MISFFYQCIINAKSLHVNSTGQIFLYNNQACSRRNKGAIALCISILQFDYKLQQKMASTKSEKCANSILKLFSSFIGEYISYLSAKETLKRHSNNLDRIENFDSQF